MIIGLLEGNKVKLGATEHGFAYKNRVAFDKKTDEICYIAEYGVEGGIITEDSSVYRYADFLEMATNYVNRNQLSNTPQDIAESLFDSVDWCDPNTLLLEWEMDLDNNQK